MDSIIDRLRRSVAQRGMVGTAQLCAKSVLGQLSPAARRAEAVRERRDLEFDQRYGVDTAGVFRPKKDSVVGNNWALGGNYQAIDPDLFNSAMEGVAIEHSKFTFVDLGSGKGRMLLLAAGLPFRKVVGVEYCETLNEIARENILRFPDWAKRCDELETITGDAAEYPIPEGPLVIFLYHPFGEPVMTRVRDNVVESWRKNPRRIVVVYLYPYHSQLWDDARIFQRSGDNPVIFDTAPPAQSGASTWSVSE